MCGVWGFISKWSNGSLLPIEKKLFWRMMVSGTSRGVDGLGVMSIRRDNTHNWVKSTHNPFNLHSDELWKNFLDDLSQNAKLFVGHNRYATKGAVTTDNAHPFSINEELLFMHNGTIDYGLKMHEHPHDTVDSHVLAQKLHTQGPSIFEDISGAWTCIWIDSRNKTLNFLRNGKRPITILEGSNGYYWASEKKMLEWILDHCDIKAPKEVNLPLDTVVSYSYEKNKFLEETITLKKPHSHHYTGNGGASTKQIGFVGGTPTKKFHSTVTTLHKHGSKKSSKASLVENLILFYLIDKEVFDEKNNLYIYKGISTIGEAVEVRTNKEDIDLSKLYEAPMYGYRPDGKDLVILVKARDMKESDAALTEGPEPVTPEKTDSQLMKSDDVVLMRDGLKMTERAIYTHIKYGQGGECLVCNDKMDSNKPDVFANMMAVINKSSNVVGIMCPSCADTAVKGFKMKKLTELENSYGN